ncbi:MAG TPA: ATPase domain-containing protein [Fibrobacteria bacterium]|nr:ATPase domain-containing protein [Fibrobacteria bacterium]
MSELVETPRAPTGCVGLDSMMRGGLVEGYCAVVEGSPGTGKTTLGLQFLVEGARRGEPGLAITFEEFPEQYYENAQQLGWDLRALEAEGLLKVQFSDPLTFIQGLQDLEGHVSDLVEELGAKRLLVDSVSHFERLTEDAQTLRRIETDLIHALKREGLTSILLKENPHVLGGWDRSDNRVAFIADALILLRYIELESEIKRGVVVLKLRGSDHDKEIRQYSIQPGGMVVGDVFQGVGGLFIGTGARGEKG